MKLLILLLIDTMLMCVIPAVSRADELMDKEIVFHGSTPGDDEIKTLLAINLKTKVDFIRWYLTLDDVAPDQRTFTLDIVFGEARPNTLGFIGGGEKRSFDGKVTVSQDNVINGEIYHLTSAELRTGIRMVKLNENLLHLLNSQGYLMVGNGGWSYTLNRMEIIRNDANLPVLKISGESATDTIRQVTFDGRTPCQDFAADHNMTVSASCFKLKWRLVLNRDPISHQPTTYTMRKIVDNQPRDVSGNWKVVKGVPGNAEVIIYQLDPGDAKNSISLLVGDENVIFFLDKRNMLYVGNSDFSFTLNKKK